MDEIKEVELKVFDNLESANILRNTLMENVKHLWVIVKNPKPSNPNYRLCVMNVWGSSPTASQIEECNKFIN